jgi:ABC-type transporter MlaC component
MKKIVALIILILCITLSCSRLDLAVNLANSYITNKTDDFFDLTSEQSKWLKQALAKDITKVKKTIFPQLATEMFNAAETLSSHKTFDSTVVLTCYKRLEALYYDGLKLFSATAMDMADKIMPAQIEYFQKQSDKKLSEMKEDPEKKSYNKIKKHFDSWMGGMTSGQKKELISFIEIYPPPVK